ncbi:MAG: peptidoglycan-associated lipoprotein Pal [Alphaproteobacteria bacterium]|nr:peptidoglycan-associated lipoprotein Pal [Alphaproteobacteria bacterium]
MMFRFLSICAAIVFLAACSSDSEDAGNSAGRGMTTASATPTTTDVTSQPVTPGSQEELVQIGDRVFFEVDRYDLTSEAQAQLQRQAAWLQQYPANKVIIEGHCDERGTREYNLALGERRATAVKNYLVALGISDARLQTVSYGKERPEATGSDESAWSQNRRSVMVLNNQ